MAMGVSKQVGPKYVRYKPAREKLVTFADCLTNIYLTPVHPFLSSQMLTKEYAELSDATNACAFLRRKFQ